MVAKVEPKETVTTRSKAFSLDSVRLPLIRSMKISAGYATEPTTSTRRSEVQLTKIMRAVLTIGVAVRPPLALLGVA